jgi:hypothetical protein
VNLEQYINKHLAEELETGKKVFLISDETFVSAAKVRDKGVVAKFNTALAMNA